ncbi:hypothetical protein F5Y17DRAFT_138427 [Xylariaceae sp. FL0594]|nr:hypothetical protein F5Y17DRAFT_138427 [Xylariaceae sp. FL0594]
MAPLTLAAQARAMLTSSPGNINKNLSRIKALAIRAAIFAIRDDKNNDDNKNKDPQALDPAIGVTDPKDINNTFIFVLFGLIGVGFVVTGIWFFFWAKNGGFYFKETDWDDYKSTVLRRKGPNGTILSGATESTDLGGGSIYKDVVDNRHRDMDARTEYTGGLTEMTHDTSDTMSTLTGITAGPSDIGARERRRRAKEQKIRDHEKKKRERKNREKEKEREKSSRSERRVGKDGVLVDEEAEEDAKRNLRAYRHERPARVGGLNGQSEGSEWGGSTNPEMSTVSGSEYLLAGKQATPTREKSYRDSDRDYEKVYEAAPSSVSGVSGGGNTREEMKKKAGGGGIRKVYSTADRNANRENERLRNEARRLAEKGRRAAAAGSTYTRSNISSSSSTDYTSSTLDDAAPPRRNYSFQRATAGPSRSSAVSSAVSSVSEETESMISAFDEEDHHRNSSNNNRGRGIKYLPAIGSDIQEEEESDLGTKSYRHYIPGISSSIPPESSEVGSNSSDYIEEQRRKRGAQRYSRRG